MDALILAAGFSRRLEPLTLTCAKPLLSVRGQPMINHILNKVEAIPHVGRTYVVSNGKFYPDFLEWQRYHPLVDIINDETMDNEHRLGAIRDIDFAIRERKLKSDLLVVAGDNLFDASLADFTVQGAAHAPKVTIGVVDLKDKELIRKKYGVVQMSSQGQVTDFFEKPEDPVTTLVSTGIYYFPAQQLRAIQTYLQSGGKTDNIGDLIHALVVNPGVHGSLLPGRWLDIGDLASYRLADETF